MTQQPSGNGDLNWTTPNETMTDDQLNTVIVLERFGASASLVAVMAVFVTYFMFKRLRTVPNLFIFMASVANVFASVACLIGRDGVDAGESSVLCQAQAFLLEMFMQSDPWWSAAMTINVYLVLFRNVNVADFKKRLWIYAAVCYGMPFIPALALLFVRDEVRGPVYGDATLWCWIEPRWNALRIYTYYLPIWVCILVSVIIYAAVGVRVFRQRNRLRDLTTFSNVIRERQDAWTSQDRESAEKNPPVQDYYATATTEVQISSSNRNQPQTPPMPAHVLTPSTADDEDLILILPKRASSPPSPPSPPSQPCSPCSRTPPPIPGPSIPPPAHLPSSSTNTTFKTTVSSSSDQPTPLRSFLPRLPWPRLQPVLRACRRGKSPRMTADPVKRAYLRTSMIFALSVLFTWTPSSINRVYSLLHPETVSFGLNVASAFVLPLQGVWNAVIYFSTSWKPLCEEVEVLRRRRRGLPPRLPLWKDEPVVIRGRGKVSEEEESEEVELREARGGGRGEIRVIRGTF